jgi:hypothetical protein
MKQSWRAFAVALLLISAKPDLRAFQDTRVNVGAQLQVDFAKRLSEYMKLRSKIIDAERPLKPTHSQTAIAQHERKLAQAIRQSRESAKQGDIFTQEVCQEFKRLIGIAMQGSSGTHVQQSLKRAEPVSLHLEVNRAYPSGLPLQSTPPTLLENLPVLPKGLEYRIVGRDLVLRDVDANLIIDFITHALP